MANHVLFVPGLVPTRRKTPLRTRGWQDVGTAHRDADMDAVLEECAKRGSVLFVPPAAHVSRSVERILVPHDGTPSASLALDAAEEVGAECHAEIVVLHVVTPEPPTDAGSLPAPRFLDHGWYEWAEWRVEFSRRFCQGPSGKAHRLEVALGPPWKSIPEAARRLEVDLMVLAWHGSLRPTRARSVRRLCPASPCPVLIVKQRVGQGPLGASVEAIGAQV
jgi:nucleotide-binding universal stress UspA family protein